MKWLKLTGLCIIYFNAWGQVTPSLGEVVQIQSHNSMRLSDHEKSAEQRFAPLQAVNYYSTDFENASFDVFSTDFNIEEAPGIVGKVLQTPHPYPISNEHHTPHKLSAQLRHPIILDHESALRFDEIVLVEPHESKEEINGSTKGDYVCVEASSNKGLTWHPLTREYNSSSDKIWSDIFMGSIVDNQSYATGTQSIFRTREVSLVDNDYFSAGDTILVRFSLVSDIEMNGWGWAIDNIRIGTETPAFEEKFVENFSIFPNPCSGHVTIRHRDAYGPEYVNLMVAGLDGRILYKEMSVRSQEFDNRNIDLSKLASGVYIVSISDGAYYRRVSKLIKR